MSGADDAASERAASDAGEGEGEGEGGRGVSVAQLPPTDLPMTSRRAHAVRTGGERGAEDEVPREARPPGSPAEWAYRRLILYVARFEEALDAEHEVAMGYTDGGTGVIRIEGMGHFDPDIVTFYGTDPRGMKVQLIQHVSQLSVLLRAVPKRRPKEAPRRIGFRLRADLEDAEEAAAASPAPAPAADGEGRGGGACGSVDDAGEVGPGGDPGGGGGQGGERGR